MVKVVSDRIRANNWIYRVQLNEKCLLSHSVFFLFESLVLFSELMSFFRKVKLYTALACFVGNRTIKTVSADNRKTEVCFRNSVLEEL